MSAVGSYRSLEFTDSVQSAGNFATPSCNLSHHVLQSPRARVECVQCHVGPGAGWYVRSKLSGSYPGLSGQSFHKYPQPIPTPVANLRPAQETCEQCHWPRKFYGAQLKSSTTTERTKGTHRRQIRMLINTAGSQPNTGVPSGIHWT